MTTTADQTGRLGRRRATTLPRAALPAWLCLHSRRLPNPVRRPVVLACGAEHGLVRADDDRPGRGGRRHIRDLVRPDEHARREVLRAVAAGAGGDPAARADRRLGRHLRPERLPHRPGRPEPAPAGLESVLHSGHVGARGGGRPPDRLPDVPCVPGRHRLRARGCRPQRWRHTRASDQADHAADAAAGDPQLHGADIRAVTRGARHPAVPRDANEYRLLCQLPLQVMEQRRDTGPARGGGLTVLLVVVATLVAHRSGFVLRRSLAPALVYPRAVPGIVLGIGFFWAYLMFSPGAFVRNNLWGELIALCVRNLTLAYVVIYPSLMRISTEFDRAARASGAGWWTIARRILLPALRPAMLAAFVLMFVTLLSDYDPVVFLQKPGTEIAGVTMLQYWQRGVVGPVAALAVVQVLIVAVVLALGARAVRSVRHV